METKHTPTPYTSEGYLVHAGEFGMLANVRGELPEATATAAFIARACNAHDKLVKALENIADEDSDDCAHCIAVSALAEMQDDEYLQRIKGE